jgi:hypothetical protein
MHIEGAPLVTATVTETLKDMVFTLDIREYGIPGIFSLGTYLAADVHGLIRDSKNLDGRLVRGSQVGVSDFKLPVPGVESDNNVTILVAFRIDASANPHWALSWLQVSVYVCQCISTPRTHARLLLPAGRVSLSTYPSNYFARFLHDIAVLPEFLRASACSVNVIKMYSTLPCGIFRFRIDTKASGAIMSRKWVYSRGQLPHQTNSSCWHL